MRERPGGPLENVVQRRATAGLFALLAILPWVVRQPYWQGVLVVALYYAILAVAWNLLAGYGGQFSLAPATFSLLGAYTSGVLWYHRGWPPLAGIASALVVTAALGFMLGRLVLRMRGPYLSLTTVAFLEIVGLVVANSYSLTRGDLGLSVPGLYGISRIGYYYVFLVALALVQGCVLMLLGSQAGLFLQAVRDDEVAAASRGVDVVRYKTLAFVVSSTMCGLAGALYVHFIQLASPEIGTILQSGLVISMVVLGGMGTLPGPLLGALAVQLASEALRAIGVQHMLVFAALVMVVARFFPEGLWGVVQRVSAAVMRPQAPALTAERSVRA